MGSCCTSCANGGTCGGGLSGLGDVLDFLATVAKRGQPVPISRIASTDDVLDYAAGGYYAAGAAGLSLAAAAYREVYFAAKRRQDAAGASLTADPKDVAALKAADTVANAERKTAGQALQPAGTPPPAASSIASSSSIIDYWWIAPAAVAAFFLGRKFLKKKRGRRR